MARSVFVQGSTDMQMPVFWKQFLFIVALGKAAIAGAGFALAALGAYDVAFAITASDVLHTVQKEYLNYFALGGGALGMALKIVLK